MKTKKIIGLMAICFVLMSSKCEKQATTDCKCKFFGEVVDMTGLDGCRLLIKLDDGTVLEPVSLPDGVELHAEKKLCVSYKKREDMGSICMAGIMADITCLEYAD